MALPIAASLSPAWAATGIWLGIAGGGFPDWLDLRSEFGRTVRMRHRGASHGIPLNALLVGAVWLALHALAGQTWILGDWSGAMPRAMANPLTLCFLAGVASHLLSDAMTHAGIRPWLPFSHVKFGLLPRFLRSRYDGYLDSLLRWGSLLVLVIGLAWYVSGR